METTRVAVTLKDVGSRQAAYEADFVVDTAATDCVVPASTLHRAGVLPVEKMTYNLADGRLHQYDIINKAEAWPRPGHA